jgi:STE24 endopeptidase
VSPEVLLFVLIAVLIASTALEQYARALQVRHQPPEPPPELAGAVDAVAYDTALRYARDRGRLGLARGATLLAVWTVLLASGALAGGYALVDAWVGAGWLVPLLFLGGVYVVLDLVSLPFAVYATFGVEERYGFNRTTPGLFVRDRLIGYALAAVLGGPLLALLFWSIDALGSAFWLPYAAVIALVLVLLTAFQTSVLLPLFNRLTPLPEGALRDAIAAYARTNGVALDGIFVMDGSKRSSRANAFFSGLGRQKKVVLFDTLVERHTADEVVAVVAHEVGHDRGRHIPKLLVANLAAITFTLFLMSLLVESSTLSAALGASERIVALNLIAVALLFGPVSTLLGALGNALARRFEYEADAFAARTASPEAVCATLRSFVQHDLALATAHPLYTALELTHPAPVERIRAIITTDVAATG